MLRRTMNSAPEGPLDNAIYDKRREVLPRIPELLEIEECIRGAEENMKGSTGRR